MPSSIVLATLNARYIHAALGLRYLMANMGDLAPVTVLREFTLQSKIHEVADTLLAESPRIIGLGVYIWNAPQTLELVRLLKDKSPETRIILGGPEVSYEYDQQEMVRLADYVITGWGDISFAKLCRNLLGLSGQPKPLMKIMVGEQPPLDEIALPYAQYSDTDLAQRVLYVEASRGCPFKCEFCLSSLDKTAWAFDLELLLSELQILYERGARTFKFVDRTFNLKIEASARILQFFLDHMSSDLFVHFEVIPDHLPDKLKNLISQFPAGALQLEVGVQSLNPTVQQIISRRQNNEKTLENLRWLVNESKAHLHADLIFGLPDENLESIAEGFDKLYATQVHEIQLGILKRLRGAPIARHTAPYGMVYDDQPPYTVRQTHALDADTLQRLTRVARYWDVIANSGRFPRTVAIMLQVTPENPSPFRAWLGFCDWFWHTTHKTHGLSPECLVDSLFDYLTIQRKMAVETVRQNLLEDYTATSARAAIPNCLRGVLKQVQAPNPRKSKTSLTQRQERHG